MRPRAHERRGRFPHPARPHPLDARAARPTVHRPGARRRPARRRLASPARARSVPATARGSAAASAPSCRPTGSSPPARAAPSSRRASSATADAARRSRTHLNYLRREGVTRDGEKARLFGPGADDADPKAFAERCEDDRHHFRFIVSPDDAVEMSDLKTFTRDLVGQMEKDLGTKLDWVAVDHWNTEHPHVHLIVRGVRDDGEDLVISRDYIKEGMRDRARDLITQELGPRTDHDIRRTLERQIEAERWTNLDRQLARDGYRTGVIDLAPRARPPARRISCAEGRTPAQARSRSALPTRSVPASGRSSENAETTLRELGERGDIIKRMHRGLTERGIERGAASYVLAGESLDDPVVGRLVDRGLDDELKGTAYAVVDGIGRPHPSHQAARPRRRRRQRARLDRRAAQVRRRAGAAPRRARRPVRPRPSSSRSRRQARPGSTGRRSPASRSRSAAAASAPRCARPWTGAPSI